MHFIIFSCGGGIFSSQYILRGEKREQWILFRAAAIFMNPYLLISFPSFLQGTLKVARVIAAD